MVSNKLLAILIFPLLLQLCFSSAFAKDPSWMVRIVKCTKNGPVQSTGYIVKIRNKTYVKTTAHGVLGSTDGLQIYDSQNNLLSFNSEKFISNSSLDDFMVEVSAGGRKPLAVYDEASKLFKIDNENFISLNNSSSARSLNRNPTDALVQNSNNKSEAFYITPDWIDLDEQAESRDKNPLDQCNCGDYLKYSQYFDQVAPIISGVEIPFNLVGIEQAFDLSPTLNPDISKIEGYSIVPGESGAPFMQWFRKPIDPSIPATKIIKRTRVGDKRFVHYLNDEGTEEVAEYGQKLYPIIGGHVLSYHRTFSESRFLNLNQPKQNLVENLLSGRTNEISDTTWKYENGNFHREMKIEGYTVSEVALNASTNSQTNGRAGSGTTGSGGSGTTGSGGSGTTGSGGSGTTGSGGNGTTGSGGSGTTGSGGSGTTGSGGNGTTGSGGLENLGCASNDKTIGDQVGFLQGIEVNGNQTLTLRMTKNSDDLPSFSAPIVADWDNLQYLLYQQNSAGEKIFELETLDQSLTSLKTRLPIDKNVEESFSCLVNEEDLSNGIVTVTLKRKYRIDETNPRTLDDSYSFSYPFNQIPPLIEINKNNNSFDGATIDSTSLWGINISNLPANSIRQVRYQGPSLQIQTGSDPMPVTYKCAIESKND